MTPAEVVAEQSRNIGCCSMASATSGRQHSPVCVNFPAGICRTCLMRHAQDYPCVVAV